MSIRFYILRHICSSNNEMQVLMELKKLGKMSVRAGWVDGNVTAADAYAHLMAKKATGKEPANVDLWKAFYISLKIHNVKFI